MKNKLIIGDYAHSSWSLRGWLLFEHFDIPRDIKLIDFQIDVAEQLRDHAPARTVPTVIFDDGALVWESAAIPEELATRYPDAGIWPSDPKLRAAARTLVAEMHASFSALRNECPMNTRKCYSDFEPSEAVLADLDRIEAIWAHARALSGGAGPWLFGEYCAADAFFAPVAARIAGHTLPVSDGAQAYVDAHLSDPAFRRFRAMGLVKGAVLAHYAKPNATKDWPGPAPLPASLAQGPSENENCPYSGLPVTDFLELNGRVFGFCNPFCRDKTKADPAAWPAFMALL